MSKKKSKMTTALASGRKRTHGGFAYLTSGKLPEHRKYVEQYLTAARMNLIADLGPTEEDLTTAQIILIDRIVTKLGVIRCIEEHTREKTVMTGNLLAPALRASYLAYNNSVRLDLQALGINIKKADDTPDIQDYIKATYGKKKK